MFIFIEAFVAASVADPDRCGSDTGSCFSNMDTITNNDTEKGLDRDRKTGWTTGVEINTSGHGHDTRNV
jgi:hypothetical protein